MAAIVNQRFYVRYRPVNPLLHAVRKVAIPKAHEWKQHIDVNSKEWSLHLDIGCDQSTFLFELAELLPNTALVGMDLRGDAVKQANATIPSALQNRTTIVEANAFFALPQLFTNHPAGPTPVTSATILFPDPWAKPSHKKRRLIHPRLVDSLAKCLRPRALVLAKSDVPEVIDEAGEFFDQRRDVYEKLVGPMLLKSPPNSLYDVKIDAPQDIAQTLLALLKTHSAREKSAKKAYSIAYFFKS